MRSQIQGYLFNEIFITSEQDHDILSLIIWVIWYSLLSQLFPWFLYNKSNCINIFFFARWLLLLRGIVLGTFRYVCQATSFIHLFSHWQQKEIKEKKFFNIVFLKDNWHIKRTLKLLCLLKTWTVYMYVHPGTQVCEEIQDWEELS